MKFEELSPSAQRMYGNFNTRLGLSADECTHDVNELTKSYAEQTVFASDPTASHISPKIIPISNIAEYKKMLGIPDHQADDPLESSMQLSKSTIDLFSTTTNRAELKNNLPPEERKLIMDAATYYVMNNSEKVKDFEPLINTLLFPTNVACFSSTDPLIIDKPVVVSGPNTVCWNYDTIIIKPGGVINVQTEFRLNCNKFIRESNAALTANAEDKIINATFPDYKDPEPALPGGNGAQGPAGGNSTMHYDNKICKNICDTVAGNGKQGLKPTYDPLSLKGADGNNGLAQKPNYYTIGTVEGDLIVNAGGGNGQNGGKGGDGGAGGPGGDPGTNTSPCSGSPVKGTQGPGGDGGPGGKAGDGGDGSSVTVRYVEIKGNIFTYNVGGKPGNQGQGGAKGAGNPEGQPGGWGAKGTLGASVSFDVKPVPPDFF